MLRSTLIRVPDVVSTITACDTTTSANSQKRAHQLEYQSSTNFTDILNDQPNQNLSSIKGQKHNLQVIHEHHQEGYKPTKKLKPYSKKQKRPEPSLLNAEVNTSEQCDDFFSERDAEVSIHHMTYQNRGGHESIHAGGSDDDDDDNTGFTEEQELLGSRSKVPEEVRLRINSRERQRMHDLNTALDGLRQVMPYSSGPSVKKLSKMSTLLLARNYIVMLTRSLEEMKRLVQELSAVPRRPTSPPTLPVTSSSVTSTSQHHQPLLASLATLPVLPSPSIYTALYARHVSPSGGLILPSSFHQPPPHLFPTTSLILHPHHHDTHDSTGVLVCPCFYCKKQRTSLHST